MNFAAGAVSDNEGNFATGGESVRYNLVDSPILTRANNVHDSFPTINYHIIYSHASKKRLILKKFHHKFSRPSSNWGPGSNKTCFITNCGLLYTDILGYYQKHKMSFDFENYNFIEFRLHAKNDATWCSQFGVIENNGKK